MPRKQNNLHWYNVDLHLHTPASSDFQQENVTYIELLQRAESRGVDMLAFTDHNSVAGYRIMMDEIHQLELLENLNRLIPEEKSRLTEYRRLMNKIVVLPGFEFTATFGFHIIGVFSPKTPVRDIEHLLLSLSIPSDQLDDGSATVGATCDVLSAYRQIKQAGGITIAAHANSTNGVAMKGLNFGGQTRIAYTQDTNLDALEVTDLEIKGGRSTAGFFNGTKPEYPRRMHCIQGSDCHRLTTDPVRKKNLGVGDRTTEFLLLEPTFESIRDLFAHNDFARSRPHRLQEEPVYDFLQTALEEGSNIIQEFHESMSAKGNKLNALTADICAFANTNGGTIYVGLSADVRKPPIGIAAPEAAMNALEKEITTHISPQLHCSWDINEYKGKKIVRVLVPRGDDPPYALDDNKIYVRDEAETGLAVRDEIVSLVLRGQKLKAQETDTAVSLPMPIVEPSIVNHDAPAQPAGPEKTTQPRTGVEIIESEIRNGTRYFTMRDLRNGNIVKNVTQRSARKLWHYAITRYSEITESAEDFPVTWQGDFGQIRRAAQGKIKTYDLVENTPEGLRYFFGVTPNGIHGAWKVFLEDEE